MIVRTSYSFLALATVLLLLFASCGGDSQDQVGAAPTDSASADSATATKRVIQIPDGGRMEGLEVNGKREGPWASYFPGGGIRSRSTFVNGVEEGPTEVFYESGFPYYTGRYLHGKPFGQWTFFDPQGNEQKRVEYDSLGVMKAQPGR